LGSVKRRAQPLRAPQLLKYSSAPNAVLDLEEGAQATTEVQFIPIGELLQAIQEQE
jgi:hypothetical protein